MTRFRDDSEVHPPMDYEGYKSTALRHPKQPLVYLPHTVSEATGPQLGDLRPGPLDHDLTRQHAGPPVGERITVSGRLLDGDGRPIRDSLVEIWQANAAGRYRHRRDTWPAPLDPNFSGGGRCVTDADGRYEFVTIKPGPYPWGNHPNAWRPAHIHFSLLGRAFAQRLVTQMYFPGDPLFAYDPIFNAVRDPRVRERLVARFSIDRSQENWALAYEFDIVLRGPDETPIEEQH
jgi:protocatechuate 3,4-dioxygenase beta subunit